MNTTTKTQSFFDDGRYELMNGNFEKSVESLSDSVDSTLKHMTFRDIN